MHHLREQYDSMKINRHTILLMGGFMAAAFLFVGVLGGLITGTFNEFASWAIMGAGIGLLALAITGIMTPFIWLAARQHDAALDQWLDLVQGTVR
jgi:uncharacterized membrane protein